jgi:ABC-2 type transport system permease protein
LKPVSPGNCRSKVAFSATALTRLRKYIAESGTPMVAGEPGKQNVVNPLPDLLGVKMLDGTLLQPSRDYSYGLVTPLISAGAVAISPFLQPFYAY